MLEADQKWRIRYVQDGQNYEYILSSTINSAGQHKIDVTYRKQYSLKPISRTQGRWKKAIKDSIKDFSAVGYFFAKNLHKTLDVPIGIIHSSWGGSDAESWISKNTISSLNEIDQRRINKEKLINATTRLSTDFDVVLLETSGGIMVPLNETTTIGDLVSEMNIPTFIF